ncbi:hypothetical protein AMTRI_Chr13g86710 [Amborella trichopoda]
MMSFGGNNRAQVFFKQHGRINKGRIESKYTSRVAKLYHQLLSKEVSRSLTEDPESPRSPLSSLANQTVNGISHVKFTGTSKENEADDKHDVLEVLTSTKAPSHPVTSTI